MERGSSGPDLAPFHGVGVQWHVVLADYLCLGL